MGVWSYFTKTINSVNECSNDAYCIESKHSPMEKYIFTSHSDGMEEYSWAHIVPLNSQKLLCVIIEFSIISHDLAYMIFHSRSIVI